jgi:hypothetical protein
MLGIIGTLLAPYVGSVFPLDGGDATHVRLWQQAWEELSPRLGHIPAPWPVLMNSGQRRVELWLRRAGVDDALALLAFVLRREGRMDARQWQACWNWPDMAPLHGHRPPPTH